MEDFNRVSPDRERSGGVKVPKVGSGERTVGERQITELQRYGNFVFAAHALRLPLEAISKAYHHSDATTLPEIKVTAELYTIEMATESEAPISVHAA